MVGKGSVNHNSREFNAKNTDPERTHLNTEYCNEKIKEVYHELFDDALGRYNQKQKRADRKIENYYEKIRSGRQEKTFHEIIIQVGNCDNMNAKTSDGELAEKILDEYYQDFQKRNPYLKVFSAHLHMDEATPHLHIDFVPFTTKSKRGLDTRVSLKQALSNQGFVGNSKHETEWSLWVESEKEELSNVMERYGIEWEQKGTHEKHLSVYDYEKKMRSEEVEKLTDEAQELNIKVDLLREQVESLTQFEIDIDVIHRNFDEEEEFKLPDPSPLMTAKAYKTKIVEPLFKKIIGIAKAAVLLCIHLQDRVKDRKYYERLAEERTERLRKENRSLLSRNDELNREVQDHKLLRKIFGDEQINTLVSQAKEIEWNNRQARYTKSFSTKPTPRQRHKDREER
ncbi:MAG: plasmid recombination protein [Clostridia bacterium]|nr:plasmid recombination protein [Clostridia bacterium]